MHFLCGTPWRHKHLALINMDPLGQRGNNTTFTLHESRFIRLELIRSQDASLHLTEALRSSAAFNFVSLLFLTARHLLRNIKTGKASRTPEWEIVTQCYAGDHAISDTIHSSLLPAASHVHPRNVSSHHLNLPSWTTTTKKTIWKASLKRRCKCES